MPLFLSRIRELAPGLAEDRARALARVWTQQLDRVVTRLHELTVESGRVVWHVNARAEAISRMARLLLFLSDRIIEQRTRDRTVEAIDPVEEAAALEQPDAAERVENTARVVAERIWFGVYDELAALFPLIAGERDRPRPPRLSGRGTRRTGHGTARNHYVPVFSTRRWADHRREVLVVKRDRTGAIFARRRSVRSFGYERFLYAQRLEDWFADVEHAAVTPYGKLCASEVLTDDDKYFWVALLTIQLLRTPSFMAWSARGLRERAHAEGWSRAMTPALLREAHAAMFEDDRVFSGYYRHLTQRRWSIAVAADGYSFPRTDTPVVMMAAGAPRGWRCFYPVTPTKCFIAGPTDAREDDVPAALPARLSSGASERLIRALVSHARRSFAVRCSDDQDYWVAMAATLRTSDPVRGYRAWGELSDL